MSDIVDLNKFKDIRKCSIIKAELYESLEHIRRLKKELETVKFQKYEPLKHLYRQVRDAETIIEIHYNNIRIFLEKETNG